MKTMETLFAWDFFFFILDDHSRVILKAGASDQWGYINANYIEASIYLNVS